MNNNLVMVLTMKPISRLSSWCWLRIGWHHDVCFFYYAVNGSAEKTGSIDRHSRRCYSAFAIPCDCICKYPLCPLMHQPNHKTLWIWRMRPLTQAFATICNKKDSLCFTIVHLRSYWPVWYSQCITLTMKFYMGDALSLMHPNVLRFTYTCTDNFP